MAFVARDHFSRASTIAFVAFCSAAIGGCSSTGNQYASSGKIRSKEYFSEAAYGVKASPRVTDKRSRLPRGGGRDQLGKPYQVAGKWYYPKEDRKYRKTGLASWYGDAFHGRLTANGEIYDMTHLTAAHPTMPLPSYARVTNTETGSSVIVRVNDRGPFHPGRVIDLSKRAAEMLDYAGAGTANVKVEYVGRAPLDGNDDSYLMASYRPGNRAPDPSDGLPTGVMIAMNGPTPGIAVGAPARAAAFPGQLTNSHPASARPAAPVMLASLPAAAPTSIPAPVPTLAPAMTAVSVDPAFASLVLPQFGPIIESRPASPYGTPVFQVAAPQPAKPAAPVRMSYADERVARAAAFESIAPGSMSADDVVLSWKRQNGAAAPASAARPYVAAGTFADEAEARRVARALSAFGRTELQAAVNEGRTWYAVSLYQDGRNDVDALLEAAWSHGAPDAMTVRDGG